MSILQEIQTYEKQIKGLEKQKNQTEGELIGIKKQLKEMNFDSVEDAEKEAIKINKEIIKKEEEIKKFEQEFKELTQ